MRKEREWNKRSYLEYVRESPTQISSLMRLYSPIKYHTPPTIENNIPTGHTMISQIPIPTPVVPSPVRGFGLGLRAPVPDNLRAPGGMGGKSGS